MVKYWDCAHQVRAHQLGMFQSSQVSYRCDYAMNDMIISLYSSFSCGQPYNYSDNNYYYHVLNSGTPMNSGTPIEINTNQTTSAAFLFMLHLWMDGHIIFNYPIIPSISHWLQLLSHISCMLELLLYIHLSIGGVFYLVTAEGAVSAIIQIDSLVEVMQFQFSNCDNKNFLRNFLFTCKKHYSGFYNTQ